ncbi:MAG: 2-dehydropantoate 2-reductase N-terminal domain-containing protein, partial [Candidatus Omnitrophota bacterium]
MKTAVIGVGAIGGLFLGYLKERNIDVTGVARDYQIASLLEEGILIDGIRGSKVIGDLNVSPRLSEKVDLAVFATKTQNLEEAIRSNLDYLKDAYVLSTQNGVYAEHLLNKYFDTRRIVSGIVMFGATFFSPNKVTHNFDGKLILGSVFNEGIETADKLGAFLSLVFDVCVAENIKGKKYLKLFVNLNNCIAGCLGGSIQEVFSDID